MRAQKIGASADAECQPATAADLRALEQQLLSHHPVCAVCGGVESFRLHAPSLEHELGCGTVPWLAY
jgi:hypothetical protein